MSKCKQYKRGIGKKPTRILQVSQPKMSQDPVEGLPRFTGYDVLTLNASDDVQRTVTAKGL